MSDIIKNKTPLTEKGKKVEASVKRKMGFAAHPENINRSGRKRNIVKDRMKELMKDRAKPYWIKDQDWDQMSIYEQDQVAVSRAEQLTLSLYDIAVAQKKGSVEAIKALTEFCDGKARQSLEITTNTLEDELKSYTEAELLQMEEDMMKDVSNAPIAIAYNGNVNDF